MSASFRPPIAPHSYCRSAEVFPDEKLNALAMIPLQLHELYGYTLQIEHLIAFTGNKIKQEVLIVLCGKITKK